MKVKLITGCLLLVSAIGLAQVKTQVQVSNGPNLTNDRDSKMNRMLGGDDNSFYCYRVRSKGKGTSFIVEKYDKVSLKPVFSKEVNVEDEKKTKIEDVEYAKGNVFVFRRQYDKAADKMTLFFQTVSSDGKIDPTLKEVITVNSDHFEFVDFDIYPNPSQSKFLIKACHKANKTDTYRTDLILMDATSMKKVWTKTINQRLSNTSDNIWATAFGMTPDFGFTGIFIDDKDNICYTYTVKVKSEDKKESGSYLKLAILNSADNTPKIVDLNFDDKYSVDDIQFMKSNENEIVVGGFLIDRIERKGRDLLKAGVFSFTINIKTSAVTSKPIKFFDDQLLTALNTKGKKTKRAKMSYKLDYIIPVGKDVYYVGEQYYRTSSSMMGNMGGIAGAMGSSSSTTYSLEFMDVLVCKLNSRGEFEWIKNTPLRATITSKGIAPPLYKQYFACATSKNIYIMCDDQAKNMKLREKPNYDMEKIKPYLTIHGTNFMCNAVSLSDGQLKSSLIFNNKDYCFAPIQEKNPQFRPPTDCEIFVQSKNNEIFIYTENKGLDRFSKLKLE